MAIAVPSSNNSLTGIPRIRPTTTMNATAAHAMMPSTLVRVSSSFCSGDRVRVTEVSMVAICPIWVAIPVPVTSMDAVPLVTDVFWNNMFARSPSGISPAARTALSLLTGALSPVSAASCASNVADRTIRPSAGTMSPASSWTRSPGTTSTAGTRASTPPRTTFACGTCRFDRASTLALAFSSCRDPSTTFSRISRPTMTPVETCPMTKLTAVTTISMMFIGSRSWVSATTRIDGGFSPLI